jgi:hypothetical protein
LFSLDYLEIHVAHPCNLSCASCSHYSQHHVGGIVSLGDLTDWSIAWNERILPKQLALLGGEPTLHPNLCEFISRTKSLWPTAQLILKTNGFFLHRHKDLRRTLAETETILELNFHSNEADYVSKYREILIHIQDWIDVSILLKNSTEGGVHKNWTQRYKGIGSEMSPFKDDNPKESWMKCPAKYCLTLFQGRLWKCPPIAYLRLLPNYFPLSGDWEPYLNYDGLKSSCSDEDLKIFLSRQEESICGMCPSREIQYDKGNPLIFTPYPR